jgi:hypothetical protein
MRFFVYLRTSKGAPEWRYVREYGSGEWLAVQRLCHGATRNGMPRDPSAAIELLISNMRPRCRSRTLGTRLVHRLKCSQEGQVLFRLSVYVCCRRIINIGALRIQ